MSDNKTKSLLETAEKLRWDVGSTFHEGVVAVSYTHLTLPTKRIV